MITFDRLQKFTIILDEKGIGDGWYPLYELSKRRIRSPFDQINEMSRGGWSTISDLSGFFIFLNKEDAKKYWMERDDLNLRVESVRFKEVIRSGYYQNSAIAEVRWIYIWHKENDFLGEILRNFRGWNPYK